MAYSPPVLRRALTFHAPLLLSSALALGACQPDEPDADDGTDEPIEPFDEFPGLSAEVESVDPPAHVKRPQLGHIAKNPAVGTGLDVPVHARTGGVGNHDVVLGNPPDGDDGRVLQEYPPRATR